MAYEAKAIANYFLACGKHDGISISPMKIQKLVYYAHGWYLGFTDNPLIKEQVEAWRYGPVIPSLYDAFRQYGRGAITSPATNIVFPEGNVNVLHAKFQEVEPPTEPQLVSYLDSIWSLYKNYSATQLSNMTHAAGTPWAETWHEEIPDNTDIDPIKIKQHFKDKLQAAK